MNRIALKCSGWHGFVVLLAICISAPGSLRAEDARKPLPDHVPPKRSSQIQDGFGINSDLPRGPYLPWNRWWWTRMFDAGFKWIRIGQYENSSDRTSWDWIEQQRGVYSSSPELEDAVDSLVDNGVNIQLQLLYGNPMYTAAAGKLPDKITPEPGSFHNADRSLYSVFWPPKTPEQIAAFNRYVKWMVENGWSITSAIASTTGRCGTRRTLIIGTLRPVPKTMERFSSHLCTLCVSQMTAPKLYTAGRQTLHGISPSVRLIAASVPRELMFMRITPTPVTVKI